MKLNTASNFFENLILASSNKSEINIYKKFIGILTDLPNRSLTDSQLESIEEHLDELISEAIPENKKIHYNRKLAAFKQYLKDQFSLISQGYYTATGISLGVAFGIAFGSMFGMSVGLSLGMLIGIIIGATMDSQAKKQNRVFKKSSN